MRCTEAATFRVHTASMSLRLSSPGYSFSKLGNHMQGCVERPGHYYGFFIGWKTAWDRDMYLAKFVWMGSQPG
eukprot:1146043-Pelagomonas_calceolata.AAC.1